MTEELLAAWRHAEARLEQTTDGSDEHGAAEQDARDARDRYRQRIDSLDETARDLGSRGAAADDPPGR